MSNYSFKDAAGNTQTAAAASVAGALYPQVQIVDNNQNIAVISSVGEVKITGSVQTTVSAAANQSVSGTVTVVGSVAALQGTNPWVIGNSSVMVTGTMPPTSVSGVGVFTVNPVGNGSILATLTTSSVAALQGTNPWTISNSSVFVAGTPNVGSVIGAVTPYAQLGSGVYGVTSLITGTASVLVLAAPAGALKNRITHILVTNNAANSTQVQLVDNGTVIYNGFAGANGGGFSVALPVPLTQPTAATPLYVSTPTQASVLVTVVGFTA